MSAPVPVFASRRVERFFDADGREYATARDACRAALKRRAYTSYAVDLNDQSGALADWIIANRADVRRVLDALAEVESEVVTTPSDTAEFAP